MASGSGDAREVPAEEARGRLREKGSRFLSFVFPAESAERAEEILARLRREYHDATHVCFAWKIGGGEEPRRRSADAGEPSGTAGPPIAAALESSGLTDALVAVVRYYGGTKLGTGGLARAYREAAARALAAAARRRVWETRLLEVAGPWERVSAARRLIDPPEVSLRSEEAGEDFRLRLEVRAARLGSLLAAIEAAGLAWRSLEKDAAPVKER